MSKNLYNFVSSFSTYEGIKNKCNDEIDQVDTTLCNYSIFEKGCKDIHFYRNYLIAEKYLTYLQNDEIFPYAENACKYFSYWVYKEMIMNKTYSYSVPMLHGNIMRNKNIQICKEYVEDITPETFKNIENLIDLYEKFLETLRVDDEFTCNQAKICVELYKSLEKTCYLNSNDLFCKGIEKFREAYNKTMKTKIICDEYKILQPFQKRPERLSNTIPVVAITAISFASIMTYKFTPLGSWVRHRLSGNKSLKNKLEKELNASQNSSELQDMEYRVPYNSS
ncbi:PIR protein [Plasmodium vivax]|uniref:VIR protein n=1 Tax=Plasmodium vivax TaxID=5855 RepID=A0A565A6M9_PLAVI|nr:PIR protein [Plasmodium vivax]